jgi:hypothetical protein
MLSIVNNDATKLLNKSPLTALKRVTLIWNEKNLNSTLNSIMNQSEVTVLNLSGDILPVSNNYSFQLLEAPDLVDHDSETFLKDYRDLIGNLSTHMHTLMWWATNISSKNRFSSQIPVLLTQIEACKKAISQSAGTLIIYKSDISLTSSVQTLCKQSSVKFKHERGFVKQYLIKQRLRSALIHFKSFLQLIRKVILTRMLYKPKVNLGALDNVVILKSFFYESSVEEKEGFSYRDPMFGSLPFFLLGKHTIVILTHILGHYRRCIHKINRVSEINIIPVEYFLSCKSVFSSFISLLFCRLDKKILETVNYRGINVSGIFRYELYRKYNDISLEQFVYYPLMKACFNLGSIQQYIQTYENNVWEKMALAGIREVSPVTRTTGFQHAVVPQADVNLFNSEQELENMPLPDRVVSIGKEPLDIINSYSSEQLNHTIIGCGLRYEYLQSLGEKARNEIQRILVVPEGILDASPMLNYVAIEMKNYPKYIVTFRFHPALPYKTYKRNNYFNLDDFHNSNLSVSTLEQDLLNHDLCIYSGSTIAVEALSLGIPLIHYSTQSVLSPDPLFRCNHLKWIVTENDSLIEVIDNIDSLSDEEYERQADMAKKYSKNYFYPVTDENMSRFLYDSQ